MRNSYILLGKVSAAAQNMFAFGLKCAFVNSARATMRRFFACTKELRRRAAESSWDLQSHKVLLMVRLSVQHGTGMNLLTYHELRPPMNNPGKDSKNNSVEWRQEKREAAWINSIALFLWLLAGTVAFLPFAFGTSPWDAVRLQVPGNQGNWWHLLAAGPFFLAYPMIWLRLRSVFFRQLSTRTERRFIWSIVGLSIAGTISVETPFLLHLAGTSQWQRLLVLSLGFGVIIASVLILFLRRRQISPTRACILGLNTAYLANAALCLVVYAGAPGNISSRSGWLVSIIIVWPIALELLWSFAQAFRTQALHPARVI